MIDIDNVSKTYRGGFSLREVSMQVEPGEVVAFLGPNGAGKSTTLRLLLGLEFPDSGSATIEGRRYADINRPLTVVGSLLDTAWIYRRQSVHGYLRWVAASNALPVRRIPDVLKTVGLSGMGRRMVSTLSLGMRQRLGLASALLGDPSYLVFDEPLNGLDPEGIIWMRSLIRGLAGRGKGVLLSSHLLDEVAQTADRVVMVAQGVVQRTGALADLVQSEDSAVKVVVADRDAALQVLTTMLDEVSVSLGDGPHELVVRGVSSAAVNRTLVAHGIEVEQLSAVTTSLESVFLRQLHGLGDHQARP